MNSNNLRINISFKNDNRDFALYSHLQTKRDKSSYIKDLLEIKMLKDMVKEQNKKNDLTVE